MRGRMVEAGARGRGRRGAGRDGKRVGVGGAGTHESRGRIASAEMVRMAPAANPGRMLERKPEAATERVAMVARGATCVVADRSWRASLVQSARTPVSVGSSRRARSGSGKMRERARKRFEDVAMSMSARARGRDGSGGLHERRRRPRGVPRRLKHGAIVPVGAPASRRRGPTRGPPRRGSPPGGGAAPEPRGRSERQTSRAEGRVASPRRPVGYDARAQPRHPDERIFEARWASFAGKILSAPTAPDFSPST